MNCHWPRNPNNNFTLKNCLFCTIKLIRNVGKSKFTYDGWRKAFNGKVIRSFARNVVTFGVDNTSSSHTDNQKITF